MMSKGLVYYTDNLLEERIADAVRWQLYACRYTDPPIRERYHQIVAISLKAIPCDWLAGDDNFVLSRCTNCGNVTVYDECCGSNEAWFQPLGRGPLTMFRQILAGLEELTTDIAFLVEHDVLYHPSHFDFEPPHADVYYYNTNVWKVDAATGYALHYDCQQTSGLCASRELLLQHYRERVRRVEAEGFSRRMGFEPGTHGRAERVDEHKAESWHSAWPNIDIRHVNNFTPSRWRKEQFRNQKFTSGWQEAEGVPGWGRTAGRFWEFLEEVQAQEDAKSLH